MSELLTHTPERKLWNDGPNQTADAVIIDAQQQKILLIKRGDCGEWAIPGGFVDASDANACVSAKREASEEANIALGDQELTPFYHGIVDDPRNSEDAWIETSAYLFAASSEQETFAGDDAIDTKWFSLDDLPELYASHTQIVARAIDLVVSNEKYESFAKESHYIRDIKDGHMDYNKVLHTNPEAHTSMFQKSYDIASSHNIDHDSTTQAYLKKEADVMSHLRTNGYNYVPNHSHIAQGVNLFMEGFPPEEGWHWRAPVDKTDHYIEDCLSAFDNLELHPIYPDNDEIKPALDCFVTEGWREINNEKIAKINDIASELSPHFQAKTRESLRNLLANLMVLRDASRDIKPIDTLVMSHHDARQSNIAWNPEEGAKLVDWSWAGYGKPGSDATNLLIDLHKSGHDITRYLDKVNVEHCLTLIGFWLEHSTWPARDNGDMTVRRQQLLSAISGYEILSLAAGAGV